MQLREDAVAPRPLGLRARDHRGRERRGRALRQRGGGLRAPRLRLHRARAARGPRRAEGGARGQAAGAGLARRHPRRPALPHHPLRRAQHARGDGARPAASAATPTWRSPTTPPATASATTSPPSGSGSGSTRSRDWNKGKRGFRLLAGSEVNIGLDGSLDYSDDVLAALDWVVASVHTSFAISEKEMTARVLAAIENPLRRLHRPPHRPPDRPPRALRHRRRGGGRGGGAHRHDDRDQRQPQPPRPLRAPRPRGRRAGVTIVLDSDAHGVDTLDNMRYAVATARRAWLTAAGRRQHDAVGASSRSCASA